FKMVPSSVGISRPEVVADHDAIQRAAAILNEGEKVAILVGAGARGARDELIAVADLLGAGIAEARLGEGALGQGRPCAPRAAGACATSSSPSPICSAQGLRRLCWARTSSAMTVRTSPVRSGCSAPGPATR